MAMLAQFGTICSQSAKLGTLSSTEEITGEQLTQKMSALFSHHDKRTTVEQIKQDKSPLSAKKNKEKPAGKLCSRSQVMGVSSRLCPLSYLKISLLDTNCTRNNLESLSEPEECYSLQNDIFNWIRTLSNKYSWRTTDPLGFPNLGNTCYMNSSLQSLLTLKDFVTSVSRTEQIWRSVPEAQLLKELTEIRDCHKSTNSDIKSQLLQSFKDLISDQNPQFMDSLQNDAHEFLISILTHMESLGRQLWI
ncbi:ubiquitin carboxyl-terminal hydrolase 26-like [Melanotaenia boesemani]|uniref:ubiquitin carboxyl-terminal hydrolase 26-like n=1 Tax=Melanotaenia boesemani TaxID=1250792 RepID=UPI001C045EF4|nr:ubiquitin carboxyl-terminal hydrolase 26-like [Melanotaenia boesemani]